MADLTFKERAVLAAIAFYDGPGGAWPADETLARELGIKHRTDVATVRSALKKKGRLSWTGGKTTNRYTVHYDCPKNADTVNRPQCPKKANTDAGASVSAFCAPHCLENADMNRNEPEGLSGEETVCPCGLTLHAAASTCPGCGLERRRT